MLSRFVYFRKNTVGEYRSELIKDWYIFVISGISLIILALTSYLYSEDSGLKLDVFLYANIVVQLCFITFYSWTLYYYLFLLFNKEKHPTRKFIARTRELLLPWGRFFALFTKILLISVVFLCYTYVKQLIPYINTVNYDLLFYQVDKYVHFGVDPWILTHSLFSGPYATLFLDFIYKAWFVFVWGGLIFFLCTTKNEKVRVQYLLTFLLCWLIIGGIFAVLLSSVGPCYVHLIDGNQEHYLPLMSTLIEQHNYFADNLVVRLWAIEGQLYLWNAFEVRTNEIGAGISAMPSMHVSMAYLTALTAWKLNKRLGLALYAYFLMILIGSVHLAWHYAIDGYVSVLLTYAIWKVSQYLALAICRRNSRRSTLASEEVT